MTWALTDDLEVFRARADAFLRADPVANTVPLTVVESMRKRGPGLDGDELFGWWTDAGTVGGAVLWTSRYPPLLSTMPERAARELADGLAGRDATITSVNGSPTTAEAFAKAWTNHSGGASRVASRQRLYRLDDLAVPDPAPHGAPRLAGAGDRALVLAWFAAFNRDTGGQAAFSPAEVAGRVAAGCVTLWETGERPVAMAARTPVVAGMARVAGVYTPPEHRRHGYGAAITAAVTRAAQDAGAAHVVLFADLANPTSNGVYQRLGYHPVEDRVMLSFT